MASLLPLLHDLLPIFLPAEVRIARGGELAAVEERAERPPWYQQQRRTPPRAATSKSAENIAGSIEEISQHADAFMPIQLLDYEESPARAPVDASGEQGTAAGLFDRAGEHGSVPSHVRGGPKVFRSNAMVGVSDKMCVTGKPRTFSQHLFLNSLLVIYIGSCL